MGSQDRPYVRVYYSIVDDARFEAVYDDDAALATWLRLLLIADAAYPASATLPVTARKRPLDCLVRAGLVELLRNGRFRIHGMDGERERRRAESRSGGRVRAETGARDAHGRWVPVVGTTGGPHTWSPPLGTTGGDQRVQPSEPSLAEPSRAEPARAREATSAGQEADVLDDYYRLTTAIPRGSVADWLTRLGNEYGHSMAGRALAAEWTTDTDRSTLLSRTEARLAHDARAAERKRTERKRPRIPPLTPEQDHERAVMVAEWSKAVKDVPA